MVDLLAKFGVQPASEPASKPSIVDFLGLSRTAWPGQTLQPGKAIKDSPDLQRVLALPRRARPDLEPVIERLTKRLGKGEIECKCKERFNRRCCRRLLATQAWTLDEGEKQKGILGPIAVGDGKTLVDLLMPMVMPDCKVAVLFIPPNLKEQLLEIDWDFYGAHWNLPNLAGGRWFYPDRPVLHVVTFSKLSNADSTELLERVRPDLVVVDEAHNLARPSAARTKRFLRYFADHPQTRLCAWSGTLTKRSITDYSHFSALALREGSPTPLHWPTVEEWAGAIDPDVKIPSPIGALAQFCKPGEEFIQGWRRRLNETPGVISSPETGNCSASLVFYERVIHTPPKVRELMIDLERTWTRPDGEELVDATQKARCARELACGFFYRWRWPRGESQEVIDRWLEARKNWHRELRNRLRYSEPHLDSPLLCTKAAIRYHERYSGPLPTWPSEFWPAWKEVRETARPETEAVWVDEFLVRDSADWLRDHRGILWFEHDAFGTRVADLARAPLFGGGGDASRLILGETGVRSIVCSIRAHGTGKNLQCFRSQLVANPPADGAQWEQLLGRTHRQGQGADEVEVHVYRHTKDMRDALDRARSLAAYIQGSFGGSQKLLRATFAFSPALEAA